MQRSAVWSPLVQSAVVRRSICVSGRWHQLAFAGTIVATVHTSQRWPRQCDIGHGFCIKIWHKAL